MSPLTVHLKRQTKVQRREVQTPGSLNTFAKGVSLVNTPNGVYVWLLSGFLAKFL